MPKRLLLPLLLIYGVATTLPAQELSLSTAANTYAAGEQVWVNLSVLGAATIPGAYKIAVGYNASKLTYLNILPADKGPFTITPAASANSGTVTIAGFQGITDSGSGTASLVTLVFTPASGSVDVDTSSFSVGSKEVFSAQAQAMDLKVTKQATSVLLPVPGRMRQQKITIANNYIRFTVPNEGLTSIRIFDLGGRTVAVPLKPSRCKAGHQAVPIGASFRSGIYIVSVHGVGLTATKKLEVVR
ncbi:MAG: hypothetical protein JW913_09435 [Chitinispirillaceae bacterium]|nr:hypothetical protein [Chitinispirillaceae bacterium]